MKTSVSAAGPDGEAAKQAGETHHDQRAEESLPRMPRGRWWWVERCVWTERMLNTLERGVKGGKWYSLIDKVYSRSNLSRAHARVASNRGAAGVDRQSVKDFNRHLVRNLDDLHQQLKQSAYKALDVLRRWIDKLGSKDKRPLGIPAVRDRVVQTATRNVLEPIFEVGFSERSFGFRPGRGCRDALREVDRLLHSGCHWVVDADLKSYLDPSSHYPLASDVWLNMSGRASASLIRKPLARPRFT